jgi:undecaprenyl-diphosphatase
VSTGDTRPLDHAVLEALRTPSGSSRSLASIWTNIAASDFSAMGSVSVLAFTVVMVCGLFLSL